MINIIKGSDEILKIQARKTVGLFQFSDTNFVNLVCQLFDSTGVSIGSYSFTGSTVVPVTVSYDEDGNEQYTASNDSDIFLIYMLGSATTNSETGRIKAKITTTITNTNFTNDSTKDTIYRTDTDYYLKADA